MDKDDGWTLSAVWQEQVRSILTVDMPDEVWLAGFLQVKVSTRDFAFRIFAESFLPDCLYIW